MWSIFHGLKAQQNSVHLIYLLTLASWRSALFGTVFQLPTPGHFLRAGVVYWPAGPRNNEVLRNTSLKVVVTENVHKAAFLDDAFSWRNMLEETARAHDSYLVPLTLHSPNSKHFAETTMLRVPSYSGEATPRKEPARGNPSDRRLEEQGTFQSSSSPKNPLSFECTKFGWAVGEPACI